MMIQIGEKANMRSMQKKNQADSRTYVFTSGKGGVGKTNLAANTAIAMSRLGKRVAILDADLGLANVDVLLGVKPRYTLRHVIHGRKSIKEIAIEGPEGIALIAGGTGIRELANLTPDERRRCIESFSELDEEYDVVIVDTSAGISPNVLSFLTHADEIILVTTPEPTALTDAYALIKVVCMDEPEPCIRLLINMAPDSASALCTAQKIQIVAGNFLNLKVEYLGHIPFDEEVPISVRMQVAVSVRSPVSPASKAISMLARKLCNGTRPLSRYELSLSRDASEVVR
jgi:flagellar biosynthesis protein FlhG